MRQQERSGRPGERAGEGPVDLRVAARDVTVDRLVACGGVRRGVTCSNLLQPVTGSETTRARRIKLSETVVCPTEPLATPRIGRTRSQPPMTWQGRLPLTQPLQPVLNNVLRTTHKWCLGAARCHEPRLSGSTGDAVRSPTSQLMVDMTPSPYQGDSAPSAIHGAASCSMRSSA